MDITLLVSWGSAIIGILLAIVSYFLVRLINKIDAMTEEINGISRKISIYDVQILSLDNKISDIKNDIEDLSQKYDTISNTLNVLSTEHRIQMQSCANHRV